MVRFNPEPSSVTCGFDSINCLCLKAGTPTPFPAPTQPIAWSFTNITESGGTFTKNAGSSDAYDRAITTERVREASLTRPDASGHVRFGLLEAGDTSSFESGAWVGLWPSGEIYTECNGADGTYYGGTWGTGQVVKVRLRR